jgi:hypothetical protein
VVVEIKIDIGLAKLAEVIASGIGAIWAPRQLKRMARAQIDVKRMKLKADRELEALRLLPTPSGGGHVIEAELVEEEEPLPLVTRVDHRLKYQEAKRQVNIEDVVREARDDIERDPEVSPKPVDEDWIARFFMDAQDVSAEQMKKLWARILAGEVRRPGSFSLRCLETLRNMTSAEAVLVASLGTVMTDDGFVLQTGGAPLEPTVGGRISLEEQLALTDLGVINSSVIQRTWETSVEQDIAFADLVVVMAKKEPGIPLRLTGWMLTAVGRELLRLFEATADRDHVRWVVRQVSGLGNAATVHRITGREPLAWDPTPIEP